MSESLFRATGPAAGQPMSVPLAMGHGITMYMEG